MRAVAHRGVPTPADECLLWGKKGRGADLSVCPLMTQTGRWVGNDQGHRLLSKGV